MGKILFILLVFVGFTSCGNNSNVKTQVTAETTQKEYVEIIYFHGKQRCVTCNAIEKLAKEVVDTDFEQQFKDGKIIFKVIDISTNEGEEIADKYEVTWSSLYINKWTDGRETRSNLTKIGFSNAKNSPDVFKNGVKKKIEELLQ